MAFKMKKPSIIEGTRTHKEALKLDREMDKSSLPDGRSKSSAFQYKKSPTKMKDLSGDGKITKKDVLIGRGVIKKDSPVKAKREDGSESLMKRKAKDIKGKVRRAGEKVGEYAAGTKAFVKELVTDKYYKGKRREGYGKKEPGYEAMKARKEYRDEKSGKKGMDYSNQKRDQKADPEAMKKAMVTRYTKKKAAKRDAEVKAAKKKRDDAYAKKRKSTKQGRIMDL
tara:strand:+ start:109 stop:783 length:675 start_codon:yes stop_codon:yes gene_type:complete